MPANVPSQPWHAFLQALDDIASEEVHLHCLGGFVVTQLYGLDRGTADLDVLAIVPTDIRTDFLREGRQGSNLHRKHGVYLDFVTIASYPEDYESRLVEMYRSLYKRLRIFALDPYDLALAKLARNLDRDRQDVRYLARIVPLDINLPKQRYLAELRPNHIGNTDVLDDYMSSWIEMIEEDKKA